MRTRPTPRRPARLRVALLCLLVTSLLTSLVAGFSGAAVAEAGPPVVTLVAPPPGTTGDPAPFAITVHTATGEPVAGAEVTLQRQNPDSTWTDLTPTGVTDSAGAVTITTALPRGSASYRATSGGAQSDPVQATGTLPSALTLSTGALTTTTRTLQLSWQATDASPVSGTVTLSRRLANGSWATYSTVPPIVTDDTGSAVVNVPSRTTAWRASGAAGDWWQAAPSNLLEVTTMPRVVTPTGAPSPAYTPVQSSAVGPGSYAVVTGIPEAVWRTMVHRSWHRGCPVGRAGLRLLRVNYWGFDGVRRRGEMVLNTAVAYRAAGALRWMYDGGYPIRRMYRVDRFGWSRKLHGANDYASMAADNTSAFNCRSVVNKPWVRSPHATGRSVDLNTWENPYRSRTGLVPNSWWAPRSDALVAWRSSTHPVVQIWRAWGFRWTYGTADSQHVDGRTLPPTATFRG